MNPQYACQFKGRVAALRRAAAASPATVLNGIEYLEVGPDHRTLALHFVHDLSLTPPLTAGNVQILGGERVRDPKVTQVHALGNVLTVDVATPGDFSTYRLRLTRNGNLDLPPDGIDAALSEVAFSFKVDCPSAFDCKTVHECPPESAPRPQIDYLAKDYAGFRRVMLDRLAERVPEWRERSPADMTTMLVEALAFRADELSYFQDAVSSESYLGTARRRISVRRHARLLDYPFHDGCNARAWVAFEVAAGGAADGLVLDAGAQLLTQVPGRSAATIDAKSASAALDTGTVQAFELLAPITLRAVNNRISFYTWSDDECCLPAGATRAFLLDHAADRLKLTVGSVLVFEETLETGETRAQAVRLTLVDPLSSASPQLDPITGQCYVEVHWDESDALALPVCISRRVDGVLRTDVSLAFGNVAIADHGRTIAKEQLPPPSEPKRYRSLLAGTRVAPITAQGRVTPVGSGDPVLVDDTAPAVAAFGWPLDSVLPAIEIRNTRDDSRWLPLSDLIESERFDTVFVVETEDDGRAYLRFGDDVNGRAVREDDTLEARYRIGNGLTGNVGANSIRHLVGAQGGIDVVRNPLAAQGGLAPHSIAQTKLYAPQAFRRQERAVTLEDYARMAERHPQVQRAVATRRWTGSWHTIFLTVDRRSGADVDESFEDALKQFLERYRLAGHDLEIDGPRFVSLDLSFDVCAEPGQFPDVVEQRLLRSFSRDVLPDGSRGFFHPDRFTFASPVYLSEIVARAMSVPGVAFISARKFQRWGRTAAGELESGVIHAGRLEIPRLDNDSNAPENGRIEFRVHSQSESSSS
jgi:hypothetical protein